MKFKNLISYFLIISYLCIGFIPNIDAVDKIAPQWLTMNIINLLALSFIFYNRYFFKEALVKNFKSYLTLVYTIFILWAASSFFYAVNSTETLVNITRQLGVFVMYLNIGALSYALKNKARNFSLILVFLLLVEVYSVISQAIQMLNDTGVIQPAFLKGVTANRNITAFSIAIKIPFIFYLLNLINGFKSKVVLSILLFFSFSGLLMIQSRASFLASGFSIISFLFFIIYFFKSRKKIFQNIIFIIIPLLFSLFVNQSFIKNKGADAISRALTIGEITTDESITARIRYYQDVVEHLTKHPIFGVGLGNWKLKSIEYDRLNMKGYIVPYHAHSDFIQLGAELGLIGAILYLSIFLICIWLGFKTIFNRKNESLEKSIFIFTLLISLGVYSIDASLNFPIARPQVLVSWALIISSINLFAKENKSISMTFPFGYIILIIVFLIISLVPSIFISNTIYKSLKGQMFLLQDFNSNKYSIPLNKIESIVPDIPNITVTTIPINSIKARYFIKAKQYDKALSLLNKGSKANPFLFYNELLKSQIYREQGKIDSAKYYSKKAFFGLPNNDLHSTRYIELINMTRDKEALEEAFEMLTYSNKKINWKNYLVLASNFYPEASEKIKNRANEALKLFPNDLSIKNLSNIILVGRYSVDKAANFTNKAMNFYGLKKYKEASILFQKASVENPFDYSNFENAATSNYMIGNFDLALKQIDKVINEMNPLNGKCEYIKALIYLKIGDAVGACEYLLISKKYGYKEANNIHNSYCN